MTRARLMLTWAALTAVTPAARAQPAPEPAALAPPAEDEPAGWPAKYPRVRPEEYGLTLALLAGLTATTLLVPTPPKGFKGEWALDTAVRDTIRVEGRDAQDRVAKISDWLQNGALLVPFVLDIGVGALLLQRDLDLAFQLAVIDLEALLLSSTLVVLTKRTIGRVRPNIPICADGTYGCHSNASRRAFLSGHATASFAAAGTSCVHHRYLRLFGGVGDDLMCAGMLTVAATAGVMRVIADKHWATDTLVGAATGLASGMLVPYLLHYQGDETWPGQGDGELDGSLSMSLLTGAMWADRRAGLAAGVDVTARQLAHVARPVRLELAMQGRLLYDTKGAGLREWLGEGRVWLGEVALGGAAAYRAVDHNGPSRTGWSAGPTLSFGTLEEASPWLVWLRWLPVGGRADQLSGRLEWAPWRNVTANVEVSPVVTASEGGETVGAAATFGLGGRLPW